MDSFEGNTDWMALVGRVNGGSRESAEELADALSALAYRFFRYARLSREDAEDLTQDSVWHIVLRLGQFDGGRFVPWVYAILRHKLSDWARRRRLRCVSLMDEDLSCAAARSPECGTLNEAARNAMDEALATLTERERIVLECRLGRTPVAYEDIARELGASAGAVRLQYMRTLQKLRRRLQTDQRLSIWLRNRDSDAGEQNVTKSDHENTNE